MVADLQRFTGRMARLEGRLQLQADRSTALAEARAQTTVLVENLAQALAELGARLPEPWEYPAAVEAPPRRWRWVAPLAALGLVSFGIWQWQLRRAPAPPAPPVAQVEGLVQDAATGRPIAGARLQYKGIEASSDAHGRFRLDQPADGSGLRARAVGYRQAEALARGGGALLRLEPIEIRALYFNQDDVGNAEREGRMLRLIRETGSSAVVLGVKSDSGYLTLRPQHQLAAGIGALAEQPGRDAARLAAAWKSQGIYTIALMAVFKDGLLVKARPELALRSAVSKRPIRDAAGVGWADPSIPLVRDYNLEVARAAARAGFDEVQFDFIRYPAEALSQEGATPAENRRRLGVVSDFLRQAKAALAPYNVYVSATVFGSVCASPEPAAIGQALEEFSASLDYVAPMLYPSYFQADGRFPSPINYSYKLVKENLETAARRLGGDRRRLRPWLQNFPERNGGQAPLEASKIRAQVQAARDAGAGGWMLWDARSTYQHTPEALAGLGAPLLAGL